MRKFEFKFKVFKGQIRATAVAVSLVIRNCPF